MTNIVVIGMGYPSTALRAGSGIPCAALLADVPGFSVTGIQRRSERSGWKIDCLNSGKPPFEGDEPGLAELIERVACQKKSFRVTDDYSVCRDADAILIDVQTPTDGDHVPHYESLREVMCTPVLVDGRAAFSPEKGKSARMVYRGVGKGVETRP